ncbi:MAG: S41 family peptidase, partial [Oscillospiraceae bacterium]
MNKKISLGAAITFMIVVAGITFCITMMVSLKYFNSLVLNVKNREEMYKKLADVDRKSRQNFDGTINEEFLYIRGLDDKYSSYLSKEEYEQRLKDLSGKQVGIGADFVKDDTGYIRVKKILDASPAALSGLKVNDYIISIDNNDIKTMSTENISRALLGEVGTKISLVYRRDGVDTPVDLIRTDIKIPVVELKMIEDNAVIKISEFNDVTYEQFKECVDTAVQNGAKGFIFDVRNNTGGTINSVIKVLDMILPSGEIAKKIDNNGVETVLGTSDRFEIEAPIVTLVNGKTASAAELFVACIRDFEKGNSVGTKTY